MNEEMLNTIYALVIDAELMITEGHALMASGPQGDAVNGHRQLHMAARKLTKCINIFSEATANET